MGLCPSSEWGCCLGRAKEEPAAAEAWWLAEGAVVDAPPTRAEAAQTSGGGDGPDGEARLGDEPSHVGEALEPVHGVVDAEDVNLATSTEAEDGRELCVRNGFYELVADAAAPELPRSVSCPAALQPVRVDQALIFLDWDDTVLPTSWLKDKKYFGEARLPMDPTDAALLSAYAASAKRSVELLASCGEVVIVTNAQEGWLEWSCEEFLPDLLPLLDTLRVVSAQTEYGTSEPDQTRWKHHAFRSELERAFGLGARHSMLLLPHLISVGDGAYERQALLDLASETPGARYKCLRLTTEPDLRTMADQHAALQESFLGLFKAAGDVDAQACVNDLDSPVGSASEAPEKAEQ